MARQMWKVGDLAKQTGLTVRTLHHYDQIGLFSPSKLTESGHRLYTKEDIAALQQIISLKQLGFALDEIKQLLKEPDFDPEELIRLQISRLSEQITAQEKLRAHLRELSELLNARENVTTGHMLKAIQMQKVNQSEHFSPKQRDEMMKHYKSLGKNKLEEYDLLGEKLIKKFRLEMENGTPPDHPVVRNLAKQWKRGS